MSNGLIRFSVAMPESLLERFDALVAKRGLAKNRSEVVRDLVRDAIAEDDCQIPGEEVMGTLTIMFNSHTNDIRDKLDSIQHDFFDQIVTTTHVHVDPHVCMEVLILRGEASLVKDVANRVLGTKGVTHGNLTITSTGVNLLGVSPHQTETENSYTHTHIDEHGKPYTHTHVRAHNHNNVIR